jgi:hypothetical protein
MPKNTPQVKPVKKAAVGGLYANIAAKKTAGFR